MLQKNTPLVTAFDKTTLRRVGVVLFLLLWSISPFMLSAQQGAVNVREKTTEGTEF